MGWNYSNPSIHFAFSQSSYNIQYWKHTKYKFEAPLPNKNLPQKWQGDYWQNHLSTNLVLSVTSTCNTVSPLRYYHLVQHHKHLIIYRDNDNHSSVAQQSPKLLCMSYISSAMWMWNIILAYNSYSHRQKMMGPDFKTIKFYSVAVWSLFLCIQIHAH